MNGSVAKNRGRSLVGAARLSGLLLTAAVSVASAVPTAGHSPTPAPYGRSWSTSEVAAGSTYDWDSTVPTWLKAPLQDVLETQWASITSNNSRHIAFRRTAGGQATVSFTNVTGVVACNNVPGWLEWNPAQLTAKVNAAPTPEDVPFEVNMNLIIEFYR